MFVCCECCVLSGRDLCDEVVTRPEDSYRLWSVVVCDLEASIVRRTRGTGLSSQKKKQVVRSLRLASHHREQCAYERIRDGFFSRKFLSSVSIIQTIAHDHLFMRLLPT